MATDKPTCRGETCTRPAKVKGLCIGHYHRLQRGGDVDTPLQERSPQRRELREAFKAGDWDRVVPLTRAAVEVQEDGCWRWAGGLNQYGYPVLTGVLDNPDGSRRGALGVHRIVAGALHRRYLLTWESVHHTCANRACVNPEHLQVLLDRENRAESLHRNAYEKRVRALEDALRQVAPEHPLLAL